MDTGVGIFVFHFGLTAVQARQGSSSRPTFKWLYKSVIPLLFMGFLRLVTHKQIDYQEHTSEYGVHWNFFFTMAAVTVAVWLLHPLLTQRNVAGILAIAITAAYQYWLSNPVVTEYMLHGSRVIDWGPESEIPIDIYHKLWRGFSNLIAANKEGVYSTIGYLAIFMFALETGRYALRYESSSKRWWRKLGMMLLADIACWCITFYCDAHIQRVSRRMVNVSYIAWMLAFNLLALSAFLFFNLIHDGMHLCSY
jgi:phosphatidylinositol glycan class W